LAGKIDGVIGLEDAGRLAMLARPNKTPVMNVGTGIDGYAPSDIRTAYDIPAQANSAKTEVLALFEQGGYPASDLTTYLKQYKLPTVPVTLVSVNGSSTGDNGADIEVDLDLDAAIGMNPSLSQILVYIDSYENDSFQTGLLDSLNQIAEDNKATVLSISYGQDENQQGIPAIKAEGKALTQLVAQGITVFASSGDDGAGGREGTGLNAPDPGSQPDLTSAGGTALTVNAKEQWKSEIVWNDGYGATGGGVTPYSVYCTSYGGWLGVGGTSFSSPTWASMTTIVNSDRVSLGLPRVGFFNPLIYKLGLKEKKFHDIVSGNNGDPGYTAGVGYDNDTGFGSIALAKLLPKLTK
jgi:subtilase family serine protease